ncbi:MAG: hypothetical protein RLZZ519_1122 [Bacteroidota bacterium]|jgi:hypothetical protein
MKVFKIKHLLMLSGCVLTLNSAFSQCTPFTYSHLDANKVDATVHNAGDMFWDLVNRPGYEVPKGIGRHVAFGSALWVGGLDPQGSLHVAAATYRQNGNDFFAGPYRANTPYQCGLGIQTPVACFEDGAIWLASGKIMHLFPQGFQVYDPQTQTALVRYLPVSYTNFRGMELSSGKVLLLMWPNSTQTPSEVMVIDPNNNFAVPVADTLQYFQRESGWVELPTGKVLIIGGMGVEEYDPITHSTLPKAARALPSLRVEAELLPNGKVLVTSGISPSLEIYDPLTNTWQLGPSMAIQRANYPRLTTLPLGSVMISGGNANVDYVELYDWQTNTLTTGAVLPYTMDRHDVHFVGTDDVLFVYKSGLGTTAHPMKLNLISGVTTLLPYNYCSPPSIAQGGQVLLENGSGTEFLFLDVITERFIDQRWQHVWKVSRAQVQQFQADFGNGTVNFLNYPDIKTWPGNGNVWAGEDAQLAPYIDVDNDGVYDPLQDGDYPCFPGDQALWWVYNDDGAHSESQSSAFPIQVEVLAYAYDCNATVCPDTALDYTTFYHYEVTNKSAQLYNDFYLGMWRDLDIGNFSDDYIGCDTTLDIAFGFNGDANDETSTGYGLNPPAFGSLLLPNGEVDQMSGAMYYENDFSIRGNPETAQHYYGYMQSLWKDGSPLLYQGNGAPTRFMYPGDPGWCVQGGGNGGWNQVDGNNQPYDRRFIQSFGPKTVQAGETIKLDMALIYARGNYNDNLGSVCELLDDATQIKNWWQNVGNQTCFNLTLAAPASKPLTTFSVKVVPNPNAGSFWIEFQGPSKEDLTLNLVNMHGQSVYEGSIQRGQPRHFIETSDLANGIYMLQMQGKSTHATVKVVLQ